LSATRRSSTATGLGRSTNLRSGAAGEFWSRAEAIRQEWRDIGLRTEPADRELGEQAMSGLYHRLGRRAPRFRWVAAPRDAVPLLEKRPGHDDLMAWIRGPQPPGRPPLASDLAAANARLRAALDERAEFPDFGPPRMKKPDGRPWPVLPPPAALAAGVPLKVVLWQGLYDTLRAEIVRPMRGVPVHWNGRHEVPWLAYFDALARLGLATYAPAGKAHLSDWAHLAHAGGWWWPDEEDCVAAS
jgi:hypothetical protein